MCFAYFGGIPVLISEISKIEIDSNLCFSYGFKHSILSLLAGSRYTITFYNTIFLGENLWQFKP